MTASTCAHRIDLALLGTLKASALLCERILKTVKSFIRRDDGAIAVEFAMLSPLLAIGFLYMGLEGVQLHRRFEVDQILRAGAEAAVNDPGGQEVFNRMAQAAAVKGYNVWPIQSATTPRQVSDLALDAVRTCFCPGLNATLDCRSTCAGGRPTSVRYMLRAAQYVQDFDFSLFSSLSRLRASPEVTDIFFRRNVIVR